MKEIVIIGAGDQAKDLAAVVEAINLVTPTYSIVGFTTDQVGVTADAALCAPILGDESVLNDLDAAVEAIIGINSSQVRHRISQYLTRIARGSPVVIHPDTTIGSDCYFAPGVVIQAGVRISRSVSIGRNGFVGHNAVVGHDSVIGENGSLLPGAVVSGRCSIGDRVQFGASATALPGQSIAHDASIGAGAVVTRHVPAAVVAVGVPAVWADDAPFH